MILIDFVVGTATAGDATRQPIGVSVKRRLNQRGRFQPNAIHSSHATQSPALRAMRKIFTQRTHRKQAACVELYASIYDTIRDAILTCARKPT